LTCCSRGCELTCTEFMFFGVLSDNRKTLQQYNTNTQQPTETDSLSH
jgi:hypothetical protein